MKEENYLLIKILLLLLILLMNFFTQWNFLYETKKTLNENWEMIINTFS